MNIKQLKKKVRDILCKIAKTSHFRDDEDIFQNSIIDSLGTIRLITHLEEEFQFRFVQKDIKKENLNTVNNIAGFINSKVSKKK